MFAKFCPSSPSIFRLGNRLFTRNYTTETNNVHASSTATSKKAKRGQAGSIEYERVPHGEKNDDVVATEILTAALNHVNSIGWNEEAIRAGARDVFMAEEISGIFREYDLAKFFFTNCNNDLEQHLSTSQPVPNLLEALEYRLDRVVPFAPKFQQALALATKPEHLGESLRLLLNLSDSVAHHSLKDRSTDVSWYTKRMGIASIYAATELCFVQDKSENYKESFDFLSRRVKEFQQFGSGNLSTGLPLPDLMAAGFTTLNNIMRNNSQRR